MATTAGPQIRFVAVLSRGCAQGRFFQSAAARPCLRPPAASQATMDGAVHATRGRVRCVQFATTPRGKTASGGPAAAAARPRPGSSQPATTINLLTRRRPSQHVHRLNARYSRSFQASPVPAQPEAGTLAFPDAARRAGPPATASRHARVNLRGLRSLSPATAGGATSPVTHSVHPPTQRSYGCRFGNDGHLSGPRRKRSDARLQSVAIHRRVHKAGTTCSLREKDKSPSVAEVSLSNLAVV